MQYRNALVKLQTFSLLKAGSYENSFSMHPLFHWWIRERLSPGKKAEAIQKVMLVSMRARDADIERFHLFIHSHMDSLLDNYQRYVLSDANKVTVRLQLPAKPSNRFAKLLTSVHGWYLWLGHYVDTALRFIQLFCSKPCENSSAWQLLYSLGKTYRGVGVADKKERLFRLALYDAWSTLPTMHPAALPIVDQLAWSICKQGRPLEALQWYDWAFWARRQALGKLDAATAKGLPEIGLILLKLGRFEEALRALTEAWIGRKRRFGPDHKMTSHVEQRLRELVFHWTKSPCFDFWFDKGSWWLREFQDDSHLLELFRTMASGNILECSESCGHFASWADRTIEVWTNSGSHDQMDISNIHLFLEVILGFIENCGDRSGIQNRIHDVVEKGMYLLQTRHEILLDRNLLPVKIGVGFELYRKCGKLSYYNGLHDNEALMWLSAAVEVGEEFRSTVPHVRQPIWTDLYRRIAYLQRGAGLFNDTLAKDATILLFGEEYRNCFEDGTQTIASAWESWSARYSLARDLQGLRRFKEATMIWNSLLPQQEFVFGQCSDEVQETLSKLSAAFFCAHDSGNALKYARQNMICKVYRKGHDDVEASDDLWTLGAIYLTMSQTEEASALLEAAIPGIQKRGYPDLHPELIHIVMNYWDLDSPSLPTFHGALGARHFRHRKLMDDFIKPIHLKVCFLSPPYIAEGPPY